MSTEHQLARALILAHTDATVVPVVLNALDALYERERSLREQIAAMPVADSDGYYSVKQVRLILGVSDHHVRKLGEQGEFEILRTGSSVRIAKSEFVAYCERNTFRNAAPEPKKPRERKRTASDANVLEQYPWLTEGSKARPRAS